MSDQLEKSLSRAAFLQTAGKAALFAALGITAVSCSSDSGPTTVEIDEPDEVIPPDDGNGSSNDQAITVNGNTITINLANADVSALAQSEGWLNITQSGANVIVINAAGTFRAFDNNCPHASCRTSWEYGGNQLTCTCHNSIFSNEGQRLAGPAGRNLTGFSLSRTADVLTITK
jgi:nitrite reductase/ring-hydroxylating ferredoxin subunit